MEKLEISLHPEEWKVRIHKRSDKRMKITFNISGQEAEAWKSFEEVFRPEDFPQDKFLLLTLFEGMKLMQYQMAERLKEEAKDNPELKAALEQAEANAAQEESNESPSEN